MNFVKIKDTNTNGEYIINIENISHYDTEIMQGHYLNLHIHLVGIVNPISLEYDIDIASTKAIIDKILSELKELTQYKELGVVEPIKKVAVKKEVKKDE